MWQDYSVSPSFYHLGKSQPWPQHSEGPEPLLGLTVAGNYYRNGHSAVFLLPPWRAVHCFMDLVQVTPHPQRSLFAHWAYRTECVPHSKRVLLLATLASYNGYILGSLIWVSFVAGKTICNLHRWLELCHRSTFCPTALFQSPMKPWGAKVSWISSLWTGKPTLSGPPRPSPALPRPTLPWRQREHRMLRHSWTTFLPFQQLNAWLLSGLGCHSLATGQCLCLHDVLWLKEKKKAKQNKLITASQIAKTNKRPSF